MEGGTYDLRRFNPSNAEAIYVQKAQGRNDSGKPFKRRHVGIHWKALAEYT